jgi:hypothetical protein
MASSSFIINCRYLDGAVTSRVPMLNWLASYAEPPYPCRGEGLLATPTTHVVICLATTGNSDGSHLHFEQHTVGPVWKGGGWSTTPMPLSATSHCKRCWNQATGQLRSRVFLPHHPSLKNAPAYGCTNWAQTPNDGKKVALALPDDPGSGGGSPGDWSALSGYSAYVITKSSRVYRLDPQWATNRSQNPNKWSLQGCISVRS